MRDLRERVVGRRDDDDVDVGTVDGAPPIVRRPASPATCCASASARSRRTSAQDGEPRTGQRGGALSTDRAAADDRNAEAHLFPQ